MIFYVYDSAIHLFCNGCESGFADWAIALAIIIPLCAPFINTFKKKCMLAGAVYFGYLGVEAAVADWTNLLTIFCFLLVHFLTRIFII